MHASLYGVKRFSPKEHGIYPTVSKSHLEWPSRMESGSRVTLLCFKWDESYNSPLNQPSFSAWVDHSIKHGPQLAGHLDLPTNNLNQRVMSSLCAKRYLATKQQVTRHHGEKKPKIVGIKRRVEELDAPEHKVEPDSEVEQPLGDLASDGLGYQPDNEGHDGTPGINIDPALLEGAALDGVDPQAFDPNLNPSPSIPILNAVHNTSEDVNAEALAAHTKDFNSKNNIRSRKSTKLTTRSKQQKGLTGADDKFKGSKYDSYETIGVMSEDEHVDSVDKNGETITTFISHAYDFLSQEMIDCRDAIDKVTDPTKGSKKVTRKRGSTRSGPPPKAAKIGALRSWMIKSDVLLADPQWFTDGRVYKSGPEWGEPEGEELISRKSKKPKLDFARPFRQFGVYTKPSI
ncbi:unnamed protein product [Rhizoctonia solani]|uniref:Uncharacterized protein n=1 Tax=Rhizoctonia solani TaxID=456999 RepID=A0A8H3GAK2_9AGAM|nr:unnamed protein product [Rhizoctonia solani]